MFENESVGRYLYHYTTVEAFLGHILPSRRLRMSPLSEVNDPRESKTWRCNLTVDSGDAKDWDLLDIGLRFETTLKDRTKVLCFSRDDPTFDPDSSQNFGRGFAHSRMWDRYAGGHSGVCLAFDIDTLGDEIATSLEGRGEILRSGVSYMDEPPEEQEAFHLNTSSINDLGIDKALRSHQERHHGTLYFYKSKDWATENEYRWIFLSNGDDHYEYVDVQQSISGIIFGPDYPNESIKMVMNLLDRDGFRGASLTYLNGRPWLIPEFSDAMAKRIAQRWQSPRPA